MIKKILSIIITLCSLLTFAQNPHIFTKYSSMPEKTLEIKQRISEIPYFKPSIQINKTSHVDNSKLKYFPSIFNQQGNSCSQASGIRYIFSYEMNRVRDTDAKLNQNVYSYHYTWNFLNEGTDMGSWYFDGYNLAKDNGVPNISDFSDNTATEKTWMNGYNKYFKAMHNKISDYSKIDASLPDGLTFIKQYLIDHGDESTTGGLLNFSGKTSNWDIIQYSGESNTGYNYAIKNFGDGGDHAMTIAGFDDLIKIDVNSDGIIQDDEIGALIVVNSWGNSWCSNGRVYMPYKLLNKSWWNGGMGNGDHYVYIVNAKDHKPQVTAKVNIKYTSRNDLWIIIGVAKNPNSTVVDKTKTMKILKKMGGDLYMKGGSNEYDKKIEIGLDYSDLIEDIPNATKFFLTIKQSPEGTLGEGLIEKFTIIDYRNSSIPKEYICNNKNVSINSSTSMSVSSETTTGQIDLHKTGKINIFPNPVRSGSIVHINLQNKYYLTKIELLDINGKLIKVDFPENNILIPSNLSKGLYFIKIYESHKTHMQKLLIY